MALIGCPDCGKDVSNAAPSCPHCGRPMRADLQDQPSAGSAEAMKAGRQRSKFRNDLGNAIGLVGVGLGVVLMIAIGFWVGLIAMLATLAMAVAVAYGGQER